MYFWYIASAYLVSIGLIFILLVESYIKLKKISKNK